MVRSVDGSVPTSLHPCSEFRPHRLEQYRISMITMIRFLIFHILFLDQIIITAGKAAEKEGQKVFTRRTAVKIL